METITIQFDDSSKAPLILSHLNKLNIDLKINLVKSPLMDIHNEPPIQWASGKPSSSDFVNFWKDTNITLEELRKKAWRRS